MVVGVVVVVVAGVDGGAEEEEEDGKVKPTLFVDKDGAGGGGGAPDDVDVDVVAAAAAAAEFPLDDSDDVVDGCPNEKPAFTFVAFVVFLPSPSLALPVTAVVAGVPPKVKP